ncbi:hypothetical protein [Vibrio crassostreae]|uniref:hypothetical protein n=1 Tax=Vibrio crassostreae TaxID=246167 RepID=UPI00104830F2|nr:hypothetical protein [Vibrio crassostreae]TCW16953.1 hypothetical protein EDB48_11045 [Vibrio crassostreae]CAK3667416.1 putative O-Antigen ligase [Vibrio crassostreae]
MSKALAFFISLYLFVISWNGVLSNSELLTPYVVASLLVFICALVFLISNSMPGSFEAFRKSDVFLAFFLISLFGISIFNYTDKTINYLFAYAYVFVVLYFIMIFLTSNFYSFNLMVRWLYRGVLFVSILVLVEFSLNVFDFSLYEVIPRVGNEADALYGSFIRAYGFSLEPGVLAAYLIILGPISVISHLGPKSSISLWLSLLILLVAILLTFSAYAFVCLAIYAFVIVLFNKNRLSMILLCIIIVISSNYVAPELLQPLFKKITFSGGGSVLERHDGLLRAFDALEYVLLGGVGLGYEASLGESSYKNLYLTVLAESGLFVAILFYLFIAFSFFEILISKVSNKPIYIAAYICGCIFFAMVSNFQYPFLITLLVLFRVGYKANIKNYIK